MKGLPYLYYVLICFPIANLTASTTDEGGIPPDTASIDGYQLLSDLSGHWVGENTTAFGYFHWFCFDFRPISPSHLHSIYEGASGQNIITSIFLAEFEGKLQIMARNGGWLGEQYRATYFVLDSAEISTEKRYYRLVDAIGREQRSYMEFRFEKDTLFFDAYKDNSGALDTPIHHMGFVGINQNPHLAEQATATFDYPQPIPEVRLDGKFKNLVDHDSALFLEKELDPLPRKEHSHISDLSISINRSLGAVDKKLMLYISMQPLVNKNGKVDYTSLNSQIIRTIDIGIDENSYTCTYLHPDEYYITIFSDTDKNYYPSTGEISSKSTRVIVPPEQQIAIAVDVNLQIP